MKVLIFQTKIGSIQSFVMNGRYIHFFKYSSMCGPNTRLISSVWSFTVYMRLMRNQRVFWFLFDMALAFFAVLYPFRPVSSSHLVRVIEVQRSTAAKPAPAAQQAAAGSTHIGLKVIFSTYVVKLLYVTTKNG